MKMQPIIVGLLVLGLSVFLFTGCFSLSRMARQSQDPSMATSSFKAGEFDPCPQSPNCVNSQAEMTDTQHYAPPFRYDVPRDQARTFLLSLLNDLPRTTILQSTDEYIWAEVRTGFFGFTDDLEFYLPEEHPIIHVRSASRVGYSDLGANRNLVEDLRRSFQERVTVLR